MVGPDAGSDRQLELRRLGDPFGGQIGRPERLRDDDIRIGQFAIEFGMGTRPYPQVTTNWVMTLVQELAQTQFTRDASEKRAS